MRSLRTFLISFIAIVVSLNALLLPGDTTPTYVLVAIIALVVVNGIAEFGEAQ